MAGGRPPEPVPREIADAIIDWLYEGKSLLAFCRQPGMPKYRTVHDWREKDSEFAAQFARARRAQGQLLQEMAQEVADDSTQDFVEVTDKDGRTRKLFNAEHVQRSRLRVDQLNRRAATYDPANCGTKVALGGDASAPAIKLESSPGPQPPPLADSLDPATGKTKAGLLTCVRKLASLAEELVADGEEDPSKGSSHP